MPWMNGRLVWRQTERIEEGISDNGVAKHCKELWGFKEVKNSFLRFRNIEPVFGISSILHKAHHAKNRNIFDSSQC